MKRALILGLSVGSVVFGVRPLLAAGNEEGAKAFAAGQALLAKADFDGALEAFKTAVATDRENQEYAQQYALLRHVILLRKECAGEQDTDRWLNTAAALRTFYGDHHLYAEALPLDRERFHRRPVAESAILLAETQLALHLHIETVELLRGLSDEQTAPRTKVLYGLALARLGGIDEASKLAADLGLTTDGADARYFYDLARLHARIGDEQVAFRTLARAFELTPPSQVDALKADAKECEDFGVFLATADFAKVLDTPSKVEESSCSQGPACGQCPMRAKCGGGSTKDGEKKP